MQYIYINFAINSGKPIYKFICSIDATACKDRVARYINDSPKPNLKITKYCGNGKVYLYLYSIMDIEAGTELRYNYNAPNLWWRKEVFKFPFKQVTSTVMFMVGLKEGFFAVKIQLANH